MDKLTNHEYDVNRIRFLTERDSVDEVNAFIKQTVLCYRRANLAAKEKYGKRHAYRRKYIDSYIFHKKFMLRD